MYGKKETNFDLVSSRCIRENLAELTIFVYLDLQRKEELLKLRPPFKFICII